MNFLLAVLLTARTVTGSSNVSSLLVNVVANVTLLLSEEHSTRCIQIFCPDDVTESERENIYNLWRVLAVPESNTTTGIYTFNRYVSRKLGKPWKMSCYKPLKVIFENDGSKIGYSYLTNSLRVKDSVWLLFLNIELEEFLQDANLLFDCEVIVANVQSEDLVQFYEVYRVRRDFPLRSQYYGNWTRQGGLDIAKGSLYERRSNLEGLVLRVGSMENWPTTWLNGTKWEGFLPEVWSVIEDLTNSSAVYYDSIDGKTGLMFANGSWNGLVGMVSREEIDMIVSEITVDKKRSHALDLFHPLVYTSYRLYFRQLGYNLQWDSIFKPFAKSIWFAVVFWLIIGSLTISICYYLSLIYGIENDPEGISSPTRSFFFILQTLSQQGYHLVPRSTPCRILFFLSYMVSAILIPSYSASLISYLTQQVPYRPFDTLEQMHKDGRYRLLIKDNTAEYGYFKYAKNKLLKDILVQRIETVPQQFQIRNSSHAFDILCKEPYYSFLGIEIIMNARLNTVLKPNCPILSTTTPISAVYLTMAAVKNSPYSGLINHHIMKMISYGISKRIQNMKIPRIYHDPQTPLREVAIGEVFQMFLLIGFSAVMSVIILVLEKRVHRCRKSNLTVEEKAVRNGKSPAYIPSKSHTELHIPSKHPLNLFTQLEYGYLN